MLLSQSFCFKSQPRNFQPPRPTTACKSGPALSFSKQSYTLSDRKVPYHETKQRAKQSEKQIAIHTARIATSNPGKNMRYVLQRSVYNETRGMVNKVDWKSEYARRLMKSTDLPYRVYDPAKGPVNTGNLYGPRMARHNLTKYRNQLDHPIAKYLKGKGKKLYDIERKAVNKPTKHSYW